MSGRTWKGHICYILIFPFTMVNEYWCPGNTEELKLCTREYQYHRLRLYYAVLLPSVDMFWWENKQWKFLCLTSLQTYLVPSIYIRKPNPLYFCEMASSSSLAMTETGPKFRWPTFSVAAKAVYVLIFESRSAVRTKIDMLRGTGWSLGKWAPI